MKTYEELKKEFENDVEELQSKCNHENISDWRIEYWAFGHVTGWQIKFCYICNKIIVRKTRCSDCGRELIKGNDVIKEVGSLSYCKECSPKAEADEKERTKIFEQDWEKLFGAGKNFGGRK